MSLYSSITCYEEHGTATETRTLEDWTASVVVRCDWANRHSLVADVLGNRREWPHAANGPVAQTATINPAPTRYGVTGQCINYIDALVTINYGTEKKDLISESLEPTAEFITLDYKRFRWGAANGTPLIEGEAPGKLVRGLSLVRTMYEVPAPLPISLIELPGSVNDANYTSTLLGLTFPTETLLYQPPNLSRTITTAGTDGFTLTLKFMYKKEGWNKFWRHETQQYERIFMVDGGQYDNYPLDDFSDFLA